MKPNEAIVFLETINKLNVNEKLQDLIVEEYPFDLQLLSNSSVYEKSRRLYASLSGEFKARICSTLRALSTQDLTKDLIEYTPAFTEYLWFMKNSESVSDKDAAITSMIRFNEISIFHEQNHRILWRIVPPPPGDLRSFYRYLNFVESIVVTLDMVLGDELGFESSDAFEAWHLIYRSAGVSLEERQSKEEYRQYLKANVVATYYILEWMNTEDILNAVNYVLPNQEDINSAAVERSLELSENFSRITNPEWQQKHGSDVLKKLQVLHRKLGNDLEQSAWFMPKDPLELEGEFELLDYVFDSYDL